MPQGAAAYPCAESPARGRTPQLAGMSADQCRVPDSLRRSATGPSTTTKKRGSIGALTVFVLAVAGALLIPIGRNGSPQGDDPFEHDPTYEPKF